MSLTIFKQFAFLPIHLTIISSTLVAGGTSLISKYSRLGKLTMKFLVVYNDT